MMVGIDALVRIRNLLPMAAQIGDFVSVDQYPAIFFDLIGYAVDQVTVGDQLFILNGNGSVSRILTYRNRLPCRQGRMKQRLQPASIAPPPVAPNLHMRMPRLSPTLR